MRLYCAHQYTCVCMWSEMQNARFFGFPVFVLPSLLSRCFEPLFYFCKKFKIFLKRCLTGVGQCYIHPSTAQVRPALFYASGLDFICFQGWTSGVDGPGIRRYIFAIVIKFIFEGSGENFFSGFFGAGCFCMRSRSVLGHREWKEKIRRQQCLWSWKRFYFFSGPDALDALYISLSWPLVMADDFRACSQLRICQLLQLRDGYMLSGI